jgi:hypothetical protein
MPTPPILDNAAVLVTRIDDESVTAQGGHPIRSRSAVLIGVRDGGGWLRHRGGDEDRDLPVARGRVDWVGDGELLAPAAPPRPFGEALLVDLRALPDAPGVTRTFGDRMLFENGTVRVYEEILGPGQVRPMHSHAPRLIIPLTGAHAAQRFPGGEAREDRFPAGGAHWMERVVTHEIRNVGPEPFWAICVEHV